MTTMIAPAALVWLAIAVPFSTMAVCTRNGPGLNEPAWSALVSAAQPRAYFLRTREESALCPADRVECRKKSYLVPGDRVLVWGRDDNTVCARYTSSSSVTVGRLAETAVDLGGDGRALTVDDWIGSWERDSAARLSIQKIDSDQVEISGSAEWGMNDPVRVENGSVHIGEISPTRIRVSGWTLRLLDGVGNSPPALAGEFDCVVAIEWRDDSLLVVDNGNCGGANVTFSGNYQRVAP